METKEIYIEIRTRGNIRVVSYKDKHIIKLILLLIAGINTKNTKMSLYKMIKNE